VQPSMNSQAILTPTSINALNARPHMVGCLEEDSHVDIHCAAKLFHDSYSPKTDVEIVQPAMAYQHDNGLFIIWLGESLWFRDNMEHSLFNWLIAL
jgi:hypothetical protein